MSQRNRRATVATLALTGCLFLLPFAELHAAPRVRAPRSKDLWQQVERQISVLRGGVVRVWEKVGARIDDNGFLLRLSAGEHPNSVTPAEKPVQPEQ
jgi:hypothetical protein